MSEEKKSQKRGRPPSGFETVRVPILLRKDQAETLRAITRMGLSNPAAKSMSALVRAAIDSSYGRIP